MKNNKFLKLDIFKIVFFVLIGLLVMSSMLYFRYNRILELDKVGITKLETLSSNIQRVSKLELENNTDDDLIAEIDAICIEVLPADDGIDQCFEENEEMTEIINYIVDDWIEFKDVVCEFRENADREMLFSVSEDNYSNSSARIKELNSYVVEYSNKRDAIQHIMIADVVILALILVKILMHTHKELQENKKLSDGMYIDTATGIYNRSKCQEIMKTPPLDVSSKKDRAVIIFDLNDLKKTNDNLGHRAGDELIYDFAQQVKNATDKFANEIFVGRYGGDEFVAFLDEIEEQDVLDYIEEVRNLMTKFNEIENKGYNLSSAVGYGITTQGTKTATVKELFDIADGDMYQNKLAMKEKKKQEMIAQGIEVVEEVDDRL